jgi:hypothetical protein
VKRVVVVVMSVGLLAGALGTAQAGPRRVERTVEGSYQAYPTPVTGCNSLTGSWACLDVPTRPTEAFFTATVEDTHRQPVLVNVYSRGAWLASFCGKTSHPIAFTPGANVWFDVGQGRAPFATDLTSCPQHILKTTGKIRVTLSNQR